MVYLMLEILEAQTTQHPHSERDIHGKQSSGKVQPNAPSVSPQSETRKIQAVEMEGKVAHAPLAPANEIKKSEPPPVAAHNAQAKKPIEHMPAAAAAKPVKKPVEARKAVGPKVNAAESKYKGKGKVLDLGVRTDFANQDIPNPSLKSSGYILPMLYFDMGPNNLFRLLRQGAVTAYEMGRTAVVPVFHRHPRMGDKAKNPFVLPIFDTNYTVDLVWPAMDTIDVGALRKVLPIVGMRDFLSKCKRNLDAVVKCGSFDQKREDGIRHFQRAAGLKFTKVIEIKSYEELVPNDLSAGIIGPNDYKCLGVVYGKKCLPDQDRWLATFAKIAKAYKRPQQIRLFAQEFLEKAMGGRDFMAVHWRYESDWLDMCKPSRPKGARERNKAICKIVMGLDFDEEVRAKFVRSLKNKLADYNLQVIYLASPPNNIELIRLLNSSFPGNFFYADDVLRYAKKTKGKDFLDNNYKASFAEQEICFKSTIYLGAALSSWTQSVLVDRLSRSIKRHDSVLSVVGNGAPGFPELIFQFPEGNFNFGGMIPGNKG